MYSSVFQKFAIGYSFLELLPRYKMIVTALLCEQKDLSAIAAAGGAQAMLQVCAVCAGFATKNSSTFSPSLGRRVV